MYHNHSLINWKGRGQMKKRADEVLNLISSLDLEAQVYLNEYLSNAPISMLEKFDIVEMKGGTTFIYEGAGIQKIYMLVKGRVKATDQYVDGVSYEYTWFKPVKVFGVMELLLELEFYRTTLTTATSSTFLVASREAYEAWIDHDAKMLRLEVRTMGNYLLTQAKMARAFLFLEGRERVMLFIMSVLELNGMSGEIRLSRQNIADNTGLSVRTVNRAVKELAANHYITCQGMRILVNEEQKERMEQDVRVFWQGVGAVSRLL